MRPALKNFLRYPKPFAPLTVYVRPQEVVRIQTDGSFKSGLSRTAVLLRTLKGEDYTLCNTYFNHVNSTESEWQSVYDGIEYAVRKEQQSVELENDNLGVVKSIIDRRSKVGSLFSDYRAMIYKQVRDLEYVGIRWIPRELNKADDIFRI
jgi:ribonuclease HI